MIDQKWRGSESVRCKYGGGGGGGAAAAAAAEHRGRRLAGKPADPLHPGLASSCLLWMRKPAPS